ncbi:MAG TPA: phage holin family protein, partial [Candidatus Peribacterales bacterium]|nr:phage holin family protein [Candidatus Peribacterales bacterium]
MSPMAEDQTEKRANSGMKLAFRVFINLAIVLFLTSYFETFFVLQGGYQAIAIAGLTFTVLNMLIVPVLHVLSFPIKLFAWLIAFVLVNAVAVWLTVWFITALAIP